MASHRSFHIKGGVPFTRAKMRWCSRVAFIVAACVATVGVAGDPAPQPPLTKPAVVCTMACIMGYSSYCMPNGTCVCCGPTPPPLEPYEPPAVPPAPYEPLGPSSPGQPYAPTHPSRPNPPRRASPPRAAMVLPPPVTVPGAMREEVQVSRRDVLEVYVTIVAATPPTEAAVVAVAQALVDGVHAQSVRVMPFNERATQVVVAMLLVHSRGGSVTAHHLYAAGLRAQPDLMFVSVHTGSGRVGRQRRMDDVAVGGILWVALFIAIALCVI